MFRRDKYKAFMERCVEGDTAESYIVQAIHMWPVASERRRRDHTIETFPRPRQRSRGALPSPRLSSTWTRQSRLAMTRPHSTPGAGDTFVL